MSEEEEWDDVKSSKSDEAELFVPTTWQSTKFFDNYAVTEPHHVTVLCTEKQLVGTIGDFLYSYVFGSSLEESRENKRRITNAALQFFIRSKRQLADRLDFIWEVMNACRGYERQSFMVQFIETLSDRFWTPESKEFLECRQWLNHDVVTYLQFFEKRLVAQ